MSKSISTTQPSGTEMNHSQTSPPTVPSIVPDVPVSTPPQDVHWLP